MRITLDAKDLPGKWYNVIPDLGFSVPPPMTPSGYSLSSHELKPLAAKALIEQELEQGRAEIPIPDGVRSLYAEWRPTPMYRAERFEKKLGTPARIFFKYEGSSFSGSHESNTAIAQAYFAAREGVRQLVTATGNGEWGASLAAACNYFGLRCRIYMVRSRFHEKELGRHLMEVLGAEVLPSPGPNTATGKQMLAEDPNSAGSLSVALSEAFEDATRQDDTKFCWGTVMNHVLLHQSIIGLEARMQLRKADAYPEMIIGAVGGGSGFGGLALPFWKDRKSSLRLIAVETAVAPSLTRGKYTYDYPDAGRLPMMLKMYTLGHGYVPPGISAGGMRYHGLSPIISALYREKKIEARVCTQAEALEAAVSFARAEGIIASPETAYSIKVVMDEALACKESGSRKDILFLLNGDSHLDLPMLTAFLAGEVKDAPYLEKQAEQAMKTVPDGTSIPD